MSGERLMTLYERIRSGKMDTAEAIAELRRLREAGRAHRPEPAAQERTAVPSSRLEEAATLHLRRVVANEVGLSLERLDPRVALESYGVDSVAMMRITAVLEETFGPLPKTLFFEHQEIETLAQYFAAHFAAKLAEMCADASGDARQVEVFPAIEPEVPPPRSAMPRTQASGDGFPPIAIIGMSGRYPGARNLEELWQNLTMARDCIEEIPSARWNHEWYFDPEVGKHGKTYAKWGGFIEGVDEFDPRFFNISPRDAAGMDPQERLFLQCAHETFEDAGYTRDYMSAAADGPRGRVGVFVGVMTEEYQLYAAQSQLTDSPFVVSANPATIANRVSYAFNFRGPSMALDTMCSSALTAIHLACESIARGECALALAGGVNVTVHPNKYLGLAQGRFLSTDGRCRSFGEGGSGYVPAEGVGAVLLKPLAQAELDGDHILAVIKGTAINHGGRTTGYAVPNPVIQAEVVAAALRRANVSARSISYIEAHGTGTALGDPIEIDGLTKCFAEWTQERGFCAIGSIKSNIGHCESAAGIAGVTKVLLQLRHRTLVPSLHSSVLNPHIDFASTPFRVQQSIAPWASNSTPRRAGVSAFGAGGSNAHIVLEEYIPPIDARTAGGRQALIVLSARTADQLRERACRLLHACESGAYRDEDMARIAYTLQTGREAMEHRLAFIATSVESLMSRLRVFIEDHADAEGLWCAETRSHRAALGALRDDDDLDETLRRWIAKGKFGKLLDVWTKGLDVDWRTLYESERPRRISLPGYPFARERYWPDLERLGRAAHSNPRPALHPLVHENISDLRGQRFAASFTGEERFFADHRIGGRPVLPAAALLEMAREAVARSWTRDCEERTSLLLRNVAWLRPVVAPCRLLIDVHDIGEQTVEFEILAHAAPHERAVVYARGVAEAKSPLGTPKLFEPAAVAGGVAVDPQEVYRRFAVLGIDYGVSQRSLTGLRVVSGVEGSVHAVAELSAPEIPATDANAFVLHPSVLDGALQTTLALVEQSQAGAPSRPAVPFSIDTVEIESAIPLRAVARVRQVAFSDALRKFDIDVAAPEGRVCARLRGLALKEMESGESQIATVTLALREERLDTTSVVPASPSIHHRVLFDPRCGPLSAPSGAHVTPLPDLTPAGLTRTLDMLARVIVESSLLRTSDAIVLQVILDATVDAASRGAVAGLLKSAAIEYESIRLQLLVVDEATRVARDLMSVARAALEVPSQIVSYRAGECWAERWAPVALAPPEQAAWRRDGVYLISGGVGGLGLIFARDILARAPAARVVLIGRRATQEAAAVLDAQGLAEEARVEYEQVDIADASAVSRCIEGVVRRHGRLNGVLHSAAVLRDGLIRAMTLRDLEDIFAPKVLGALNLDAATAHMSLDCFVMFSSASGVTGNAGQAAYAAANAFLDGLARERSAHAAQGRRHGRSLSIAWPLWRDGGMQLDAQRVAELERSWGVVPLPPEEALRCFDVLLGSGEACVAVLHGYPQRLQRAWSPRQASNRRDIQHGSQTQQARTALLQEVAGTLHAMLGELLGVEAEDIDPDAQFSELGFDSVSLTQLGHELNKRHGIELLPTVFFEFSSPAALTRHLVEAHAHSFAAVATPSVIERAPEVCLHEDRARSRGRRAPPSTERSSEEAIAIIGMSGRFPGARDVEELWSRLASGEDCIEEVPASRWDWRELQAGGMSEAVRWGGFIEGVEEFDPLFFAISPREAQSMDPQQRLLMQYVWKAIEDAGYAPSSLAGSATGIFVGTAVGQYAELLARSGAGVEGHSATGMVPSIGPNRMSYLLDLHGPSEPIETACSSSLVAVHRAVRSIRSGECAQAIVGGINTLLTPGMQVSFAKAGMLSEQGRCRTFSAQANGYVRGEGVGMLMLKRLSAAQRDGDHIYGLILASSENHGGRANSLTAPNPTAQAQLLQAAYREARIDPRTVTYIEAHGTGTPLGDPIEVNALKSAFGRLYEGWDGAGVGEHRCGLGSIKTNVGHLELAAGVAGLIKVLLQMRHGELAKSLHSEELNPYLQLEGSAFYVVDGRRSWTRLRDERGVELPRRAGVSSFGFGGVNAHVVLEEYLPAAPGRIEPDAPQLIVLSAKNAARLQDSARQLAQALEGRGLSGASLASIAYTLQVGRDAMESRLALLASSKAQLREKLEAYLQGATDIPQLFEAEVKRQKDPLVAAFQSDEDLRTALAAWTQKGKYSKLLELWVKGLDIDWNMLHGETRPKRVSLPTYPFARDRHWITPVASSSASAAPVAAARLHPLLHRNVSDFTSQRFESQFDGSEFFLADHVVHGRKTFPAAAYLEWARAAIDRSLAQPERTNTSVQLHNVAFLRPLSIHDATRMQIVLGSVSDRRVAFRIEPAEGSTATPYARGEASWRVAAPPASRIDRLQLERECAGELDADLCYDAFESVGISYGSSHRVIKRLRVGREPGAPRYVVAELELPQALHDGAAALSLHPALLDGAFQAALAFAIVDRLDGGLPAQEAVASVPFSIDSVELVRALPPRVFVYLRETVARVSAGVQKYDLDLCTADGEVCVALRGFATRELKVGEGDAMPAIGSSPAQFLPRYFVPGWRVAALPSFDDAPAAKEGLWILGAPEEQRQAILRRCPHASFASSAVVTCETASSPVEIPSGIQHIVWFLSSDPALRVADEAIIERQRQGVLLAFRLVKALFCGPYRAAPLELTIVTQQSARVLPQERIDATHASVHGFFGSVANEAPHWRIRLVDRAFDEVCAIEDLLRIPASRSADLYALRRGECFRRVLRHSEPPIGHGATFRRGGVYVILGGAGGLGQVLTEHLVRGYRATVIWIGRRAATEQIVAHCDRIERECGVRPLYFSADARDAAALLAVYREIKQAYPQIHGVIHATIELADKTLAALQEDEFLAALSAKVDTSVAMACVFADEQLDFVLYFSSMQSFTRAAGQSNYAAGCAFSDAFAQMLAAARAVPVRVVNWGYWGSVGAAATDAIRTRMARSGIGSIEREAGMNVLETILRSDRDQVGFGMYARDAALDDVDHECVAYARARSAAPMPAPDPMGIGAEFTHRAEQAAIATELSQWCARLITAQLAKMASDDRSLSAIVPPYDRWLSATRELLREQPMDGDSSPDPWSEWRVQKHRWSGVPGVGPLVELIDLAAQSLPEVLRGHRRAVEVLFPGSSLARVEDVYKDEGSGAYFNRVLCDMLVAYIRECLQRTAAARLRIVEVGAGTGATSVAVFSRLKREGLESAVAEYLFTDVSNAFLAHAKKAYAGIAPYVSCARLDVEKSLAEQGFTPGVYDVVIAANVLHATRDIRATLGTVKALLGKDGLLLVNELHGRSLPMHLTFGLLEGWWRFEDAHLRIGGSPVLAPDVWKRVLEGAGFTGVCFPAEGGHEAGQQIIAALSDGVVIANAKAEAAIRAAPPVDSVQLRRPSAQPVPMTDRDEGGASAALVEILAEALAIDADAIDSDESFADLGIDSIIGIQVLDKINSRFGLSLSPSALMEHDSISALDRHLSAMTAATVVQASDTSARSLVPPLSTIKIRESSARPVHGMDSNGDAGGIAIIGMSGRYAQANDLDAFWENLRAGRDCITEVPPERWSIAEFFDPNPEAAVRDGLSYSKWGGFIDTPTAYDVDFFQKHAHFIERMGSAGMALLEVIWQVIEDAGYEPAALRRETRSNVGVYLGAMSDAFCGLSPSAVANGVSAFFELKGPSIAVDTMSSSAITALHLACEAIRNGECEMAIVCGAHVLQPSNFVNLSRWRLLASSAEHRSFGSGDGLLLAEGMGAVLLRGAARAYAGRDAVRAIIRSTHLAHAADAMASASALEGVILRNLDKAGVSAQSIEYIESAANGSPFTDELEVVAVANVMRRGAAAARTCAIGSVEANIGHAVGAAGMPQLHKVVLQMQHRELVPLLKTSGVDERLQAQGDVLYSVDAPTAWHRHVNGSRARAMLNSFGAGGSYGNVILEAARDRPQAAETGREHLIVLSAVTHEQLWLRIEQLARHLRRDPHIVLADVAFTLQTGRQAMEYRFATCVSSIHELLGRLEGVLAEPAAASNLPETYFGRASSTESPADATDARGDATPRRLARAAFLWANGAELEWETLGAEEEGGRVSLPVYPFRAREAASPEEPMSTRQVRARRARSAKSSARGKVH